MKPASCPRCRWLGPLDGQHCPKCGAMVQPLGQKGLDGLYQEYALLLKPGYQHQGDRAERRAQLERFFEHIDHPQRSTSGPNLAMAFKVIEPGDENP